jgi:HK97 family phage prohead protease
MTQRIRSGAMKNELMKRCYDVKLETRENNGVGIIEGQPIVFGSRTNLGYFDEIIEPGALDGTDLSDVRLCLNHDTSYVYARSRRNNPNSTMRLNVVDTGLRIEADLAINESPKARDYYSAVQRSDIDKMSFMFSIDEEDWENLESDHPTRHIKKIGSVVEVSAVTFPAYDSTEINARSKVALDNARSTVETARQQREQSVETGSELELAKAKFNFMSTL